MTSTVTFKCIGMQHDMHAQNILTKVSRLIKNGQQVPVNIYKEPNNPYDAKAVAFKCWVDDEWHRVGYVVLDDVHHAIETNSIIDVKFTWAKYLPYSGLFSRGKFFANARCGVILRVKFSRMVNKELINNHTSIYFQGENIRE